MIKPAKRFQRRKRRNRFALKQVSSGRARLSVFRSSKNIYAQVIDDLAGRTVASASTVDKTVRGDVKKGCDLAAAEAVGKLVAERAKKAGIESVVFDRGGYRYHGRVKAVADAAREAGLKF